MNHGTRARLTAALIGLGFVLAVSGCPLRFEEESRENSPPNTYFDRSPPDTTFQNEVQFRWVGTDLDSDVVAYQYQLVQVDSLYYYTAGVQGSVLRSIDPRSESPDERWSPRVTDDFLTVRDLDDGWYEFRARAIDNRGLEDNTPARDRFYVFFDDVPPIPEIQNDPRCGRIGSRTDYVFLVNATDASRNAITPRSRLEYSVQLRSSSASQCPEHAADSFTDWVAFPDDSDVPVAIGSDPPTVYQDLFSRNCTWTFTLRVRDPAGSIALTTCDIKTE